MKLDPERIDLATLRQLWAGADARLNDSSMKRVVESAASVERIVASGETVYGVNTGFGLLANTRIPDDRLAELQTNLILSHSAGLGDPLPRHVTRLMIVLKLLGLAFNEMVRKGEVSAPIVIGRDHLDSGSVASPNRETEAMKDGSDAISDWPLLNALLNTASGATWVSLHHGGGVGMGYSQHAGMVIVADGTDDAARRLERVLWNDPATGVMRHADAGYEIAIDCAHEQGLDLPMV